MLYFDCRPGLLWPVLLWSGARFNNQEAILLGTAQESVGAAGGRTDAGASAADESLGEPAVIEGGLAPALEPFVQRSGIAGITDGDRPGGGVSADPSLADLAGIFGVMPVLSKARAELYRRGPGNPGHEILFWTPKCPLFCQRVPVETSILSRCGQFCEHYHVGGTEKLHLPIGEYHFRRRLLVWGQNKNIPKSPVAAGAQHWPWDQKPDGCLARCARRISISDRGTRSRRSVSHFTSLFLALDFLCAGQRADCLCAIGGRGAAYSGRKLFAGFAQAAATA